MTQKIYNVLFICTGNSARSILAEVMMNELGKGHFRAFSAGSNPRGEVHPMTLEVLSRNNHNATGLRSKGWEEFTQPDAPEMDFVFTVCDQAAGESCPVWPGQPITAHWGFSDPAKVTGTPEDQYHAFSVALQQITTRLRLFLSLPIDKIDHMALQTQLRELGR